MNSINSSRCWNCVDLKDEGELFGMLQYADEVSHLFILWNVLIVSQEFV